MGAARASSPRRGCESYLKLQATVASDDEGLYFIDRQALFGLGIGYVDAHLLAAVELTVDAKLWTRNRRWQAVAARPGLSA
jgi:hypothetical protein